MGIGAKVCQVPLFWAEAAVTNAKQKSERRREDVVFICSFLCFFSVKSLPTGAIASLSISTGKKRRRSEIICKNSLACADSPSSPAGCRKLAGGASHRICARHQPKSPSRG